MANTCSNCYRVMDGEGIEMKYEYGEKKSVLTEHFCCEVCQIQWIRAEEEESFERIIQNCKKTIVACNLLSNPQSATWKKFHVAKLMLYTSFLDRKPRDELLRIVNLVKREVCNVVEMAHETNDDRLAFEMSEYFTFNWEAHVETWCR